MDVPAATANGILVAETEGSGPAADNIVLTPHTGYVTREAYRGFFTGVVENTDRYLRGEVPARCLNPEARETRP